MAQLIESLENRVLFSAATSSALAALGAQALVLKADFTSFKSGAKTVLADLKADLKRTGTAKTNGALYQALAKGQGVNGGALRKDASAEKKLVAHDAKLLITDNKRLQKKPNAITAAKIEADRVKILGDVNSLLAKVIADSNSFAAADSTNLLALANANSTDAKTQTDVQAAIGAQNTLVQKFQADATTLLTTDVTNFVNSFFA